MRLCSSIAKGGWERVEPVNESVFSRREVGMPLVGEMASWHWAYTTGGDFYSATWSVDFAPSAAFAKVSQGRYFEFDDQSAADIAILNIRRRKPDNSDEQINFDQNIDALDSTMAVYDPKMTHVTFKM